MTWLAIIAVAGITFLTAALVLRFPRRSYPLLGAALLFGLAGYALQGSPEEPAAPAAPVQISTGLGEPMVEARRAFFESAAPPSRFLITSDAFARRGDPLRAAGFALSAVTENAGDGEGWTALGNALVEHAEGQLTPAALYAYSQAERSAPGSPAPDYFLGLAWLRSGEPDRTRAIWSALLARAPRDAPWRPVLAARLARLETLMAQTGLR